MKAFVLFVRGSSPAKLMLILLPFMFIAFTQNSPEAMIVWAEDPIDKAAETIITPKGEPKAQGGVMTAKCRHCRSNDIEIKKIP